MLDVSLYTVALHFAILSFVVFLIQGIVLYRARTAKTNAAGQERSQGEEDRSLKETHVLQPWSGRTTNAPRRHKHQPLRG